MRAAIVKRKNTIDIYFLNEKREVVDIFEVSDVELYNSIDDLYHTLPKTEPSIQEIVKKYDTTEGERPCCVN